ncbi:MAG TPA: hypothetical protein DCM45_05100 [Clostridiales bacterium]|nr:hypothetical protein [Clostridiales bacterium]
MDANSRVRNPSFRKLLIIVIAVLLIASSITIYLFYSAKHKNSDNGYLRESINIQIRISGFNVTNQDITDSKDKQLIRSIIANCESSPEFWDGQPPAELPDGINILLSNKMDKTHLYYTVIIDESSEPVILDLQNNQSSRIDDQQHLALLNIVRKGFYEKPIVTVRSGDNTIQALGHWVNSYNKITKLAADSLYLSAQGVKPYVTYLPIEFIQDAKNGQQPFAAYVNGREISGEITLYDYQMNKIKVVGVSGHTPQSNMLNNLAAGNYIVELRTRFETLTSESGYQYFFGIRKP